MECYSFFDLTTTDVLFYDKMLNNTSNEIKLRHEIKYISPAEYFKICSKIHESTIEDEYKLIDYENLKHLSEIIKNKKLPLAFLNMAEKSHEGRHRAFLAKQLGLKKMPVMFIYENI